MTSSDQQADATSPKRKRKTSSDKRIKPKRRKHVASVNTQLLELKHVTSSDDSHSAGESSGNLNTSFQT
jgi:hypothetical protein